MAATRLEPQAALEQAVLDRMQTPAPGGLGWLPPFSGRRFDGRPPPVARGKWYAAVWSDGSRQVGRNNAARTALDETFGVSVTITLELVQPFDRWLVHRDELEEKVNALRAMIHADTYSNLIINAANSLSRRRRGDLATDATQPVGTVRGLAFEALDPVALVGADWFNADADDPRCGLTQRVRFGGAILLQDLGDME